MKIYRLSVDYFCKLCKTPFKLIASNLDLDIKDIGKKLPVPKCMVCEKPGHVEVAHIECEEKISDDTRYICTIRCNLCGTNWSEIIRVSAGTFFADNYKKILNESKCVTSWCENKKVIPNKDYSEHKQILAYRKID